MTEGGSRCPTIGRGCINRTVDRGRAAREYRRESSKIHEKYAGFEPGQEQSEKTGKVMDSIRNTRVTGGKLVGDRKVILDPVDEIIEQFGNDSNLSNYSEPEIARLVVTATKDHRIQNDEEAGVTTIPKYLGGFGTSPGLLIRPLKRMMKAMPTESAP